MQQLTLILTLAAGILLAPICQAQTLAAVDKKQPRVQAEPEVVKINTTKQAYPAPNIYQAVANAITQSAVRHETLKHRKANPGKHLDVTVRGNRVRYAYKNDAYGSVCSLVAGRSVKWESKNGEWTGARVSMRTLNQALSILKRNGLIVTGISMSVRTQDDRFRARDMVTDLGLKRQSLIGVDPNAPTVVRITFARSK